MGAQPPPPLRRAGAARRAGFHRRPGARLGRSGGRIVSLATPRGAISPGTVIFATGSIPGRWFEGAQGLVKGTILVTHPAPFQLQVAVIESILVRQLPDGRLLAGSALEDDLEPEVLPQRVAEIRADLARIVPGAATLSTRWAWCCFRPGTPDSLPVVDRLPGLDNAFVSAGHYRTGILAGPGIAALLAGWIAGAERPPELLPLALGRFAKRSPG
ncbi:MAG TPA: FAD-binding oxidoreductase [Candidatus Dormibacteraeota bacterium]|nr:FAD-binding oxidoreductase [Candidatus Dormibacteraeota bacterium]